MTRVARLLVAVLVLISLAAGPVTAAGAPDIVREPVADNRFFPARTRCEFAIAAERTGTLTTKMWTDDSGTITRQTFTWSDGKIVYTNPANGKSVRTLLAGPFVYEPLGDGTALIFVPGNDQAVVAPGLGFIVGRTGLSWTLIDDATGALLDVVLLAGHQDAPFPEGCVALA
jgi:hypothetical protein